MRHALLLAVLATACTTEDPVPDVTFQRVEDEVIQPSCAFSICHGGGSSGGLSLTGDAAADHASLVGVLATGVATETLVIPGDPDGSYLIRKLEGDSGIAGDAMPSTGPLTDEQIQLVRDWIADGAQE